MRRWLPPSTLVFALALLGSLAVHLPAYEVLGVLAHRFRSLGLQGSGRVGSEPVQVEVVVDPPAREATEPPPEPERPEPPPERARPEPERAPVAERPPPQPSPEPPPERARPEPQRRPSPPPEPVQRLAVTQRGNREEAPQARFAAREANRVEEETVARSRNLVRDDPEPSPQGPPEPRAAEGEGSARDDVVAELREREGSRERRPTPEQAQAERPDREAPGEPARRPDPPLAERPSATPPGGEQAAREAAAERPDAPGEAPGPPQRQELAISDGQGTLRFEVSGGGAARPAGGRRRPAIALAPRSPGSRPSYSELQAIYGAERLEAERQAWLQERRSRRAGSRPGALWNEFRAAIENHVPAVRPGNQTALNAAASPFADYLAAVHRRIHVEYAENFVGRLPTYSTSPYADRTLHVELEIVIAPDGSVHRIAVVRTSGLLAFDYGAYAAVMRAQPFPKPPRAIRSADGRVYFHWGFYRNQRLCGTFNARPFILRSVPGEPPRRAPGPVDEPPRAPPSAAPRAAEQEESGPAQGS